MKRSVTSKFTCTPKIIILGIVVLLVLVLPIGNSLFNWWHNHAELRRLTQKRGKLDVQYERLLAEKKLLETRDPAFMEKLARNNYHMVKPGEIEYRIVSHDAH